MPPCILADWSRTRRGERGTARCHAAGRRGAWAGSAKRDLKGTSMRAMAVGPDGPGADDTRALHLVDLDSLLGPGRVSGVDAYSVVDAWLVRAGWKLGDRVSVAGRHPAVVERIVWQLAVGARMYAVCGHDTVDGMLRAYDVRLVARRFARARDRQRRLHLRPVRHRRA